MEITGIAVLDYLFVLIVDFAIGLLVGAIAALISTLLFLPLLLVLHKIWGESYSKIGIRVSLLVSPLFFTLALFSLMGNGPIEIKKLFWKYFSIKPHSTFLEAPLYSNQSSGYFAMKGFLKVMHLIRLVRIFKQSM